MGHGVILQQAFGWQLAANSAMSKCLKPRCNVNLLGVDVSAYRLFIIITGAFLREVRGI
jgi:hypothetical protein